MRYRVSDLPLAGAGAFTPLPFLNPEASSHGLVRLEGSPGTLPVPSPAPQRDWAPSLTRTGGVNSAQGSMVSPDVILPSIYFPYADNMGPEAGSGIGMTRRRYCELPVPAENPRRLPKPTMRSPQMGGRSVMAWPRAFQRWPLKTPGTS
jgi:hypothetical protein